MNEQSILTGVIVFGLAAAMLGTTCHAQAPANEANASAQAPATFVNSLGMKMIRIKAEPFDAWTPSFADWKVTAMLEVASAAADRPNIAHRVELPGDFFLAEFPVTNKMYRQFVAEHAYDPPGGAAMDIDRVVRTFSNTWEYEQFNGDDLPVAGISPQDAAIFCQWLSNKEGRTYRLPEMYEWEYACRAGTDTYFWWGKRPDPRYMNFAASRIDHPTPVGLYPPNPWGLYDMHGNVWECCDQIGRPGGMQKGGSWNSPADLTGADVYMDIRGTFTPHMPVTRRLANIGFRLACNVEQAAPRPGDLKAPTILPAGGKGPDVPELDIQIGEKIDLGNFPGAAGPERFFVTKAGTWLLGDRRSTDRGKTWKVGPNLGVCVTQLRDGTIIAAQPHLAQPMNNGTGMLDMAVSTDDWKTAQQYQAPIHIPLAIRFDVFEGLIELDDGRLLMSVYGKMDGDQVRETCIFAIEDQYYKVRVVAVVSEDRGKTWRYLSTICNHPEMTREGADETDLIKLPTGDLFAAMRTGMHGYWDPHGRDHFDEPLLIAWSRNQGKSWSEPTRIHIKDKLITGIYPRAVLTQEGVLAVLRCRPDGSVIFSPDGSGTIWTDEVVHYTIEDAESRNSMQNMDLIGPNTLLVIDSFRDGRTYGIPITVTKKK